MSAGGPPSRGSGSRSPHPPPGARDAGGGGLLTPFAAELDPERVHPEYPRPQLARDRWLSLNGWWDFRLESRLRRRRDGEFGRILVPFPVESMLSGVARRVGPLHRMVYRRVFSVPESWAEDRVRLHFGAVDHDCRVWLNGRLLGSHRGGYTPFSFDLEGLRRDAENELRVEVVDPTGFGGQERGKQSLHPVAHLYTAVSGIWQTVWLEPVPEAHLRGLRLRPDLAGERLLLRGETSPAARRVHARALLEGRLLAEAAGRPGEWIELRLPGACRWSPESPVLHDLELEVHGDRGPPDRVRSYFGMRSFDVGEDARGRRRLRLNGEPRFFLGLLDQGYWPDGLYTAPTDDALRFDVEETRRLGFDLIRKHVKVEPARFYHHCDRLGVVVWQDIPNGGHVLPPCRLSRRSRAGYWRELAGIVAALENAPSVGMWIAFNEGWGQFRSREVAAWLAERDPTRPVNAACGWFDRGAGDVRSHHRYPGPALPPPDPGPGPGRARVLGEFGGLGLVVPGHTLRRRFHWAYRRLPDAGALLLAYERLMERLGPLVDRGLSGAVYTQTTDVEGEVNGLLTYDRAVRKLPVDRLRELHLALRARGREPPGAGDRGGG